ncbi:hypothetical protein MRX96_023329 [Rhipicephalus microplus]
MGSRPLLSFPSPFCAPHQGSLTLGRQIAATSLSCLCFSPSASHFSPSFETPLTWRSSTRRPPYQTERFGETRKGASANACAAENSGGRSFSACQTELGAFYSLYFIRASQQDAEATVKRSRGSGRKRAEERSFPAEASRPSTVHSANHRGPLFSE